MKELKTLGKNVGMVFFARGFDLLASLAIIAMLTRHLSIDLYGKYSFVMALVFTLTSFSHMGMSKILVREVAQNKTTADLYLGASLLFSTITFACVIMISMSVITFLGLEKTLILPLFIAILAEMLNIVAGIFNSMFIAFEKMGFDTATTALHNSLLLILLVLVVFFKLDFVYIFLSMLMAHSFGLFSAAAVCLCCFSVRPVFRNWKNNLKYLSIEVFPVGFSLIILQGYQYVDIFVLKYLRGFGDVALFQAPYALLLKGQLLPRILVMAFAPLLSRLALADSSYNTIGFLYIKILKYLAIISIPFSVVGAFFADFIVVLLFGKPFLESAAVLKILMCAIPFMFMDFFSDVILISIGRQKITVITTGISLVVNLILAIIFISNYGYIGAGVAFLLSSMCLFIMNYYFLSRYLTQISLFSAIGPPGAAVLLASLPMVLGNLNGSLTALGFSMAIFIGVLLAFRIFSKEDLFAISRILDQARGSDDTKGI
jgi:O-antigen/teichoic acid export membrane protein